MSDKIYSISKTSFLKFEQCQKAFFLYKNFPYLKDKVSIDKQLTFKRGHDVGYLAQELFPGGIDVSALIKSSSEGIAVTKDLIEKKTAVIYEATFVHQGVLIMVDILCFENGHYTAYEVKSSLKVSDHYVKDACLQYYVLKNNLEHIADFYLVTLNGEYTLTGELDLKKLFKKRSVKQKAEDNFSFFQQRLIEAHAVLEQNTIPNVAIGKHCFRPYPCDFMGVCWKETLTEKSIFNLPLIDKNKLFEWFDLGLKNIDQLHDDLLEKESYRKIKQAFLNKTPIIDHEKIDAFVAKIKLPVAAMDMEIWSGAIPKIEGTRPFEQLPFLVCFYEENKHSHFFTANDTDGRQEFAHQLVEMAREYKTILTYDKTMEVGIIDDLSRKCPVLKDDLEFLKSKFLDVFDLFLGLAYYHPDFQNNFSLKTTSSLLLADIKYHKISSGLEAMNFYEQYRQEANAVIKEDIKNDLIDYCETDTLATFKLMEFVQSLSHNEGRLTPIK